MRILDENDQELQQEDLNLTLGYLVSDQILKEHHDAVPEVQEEGHYYPETFYFMDGSQNLTKMELASTMLPPRAKNLVNIKGVTLNISLT